MKYHFLIILTIVSFCRQNPAYYAISNYLVTHRITIAYFYTCWSKKEVSQIDHLLSSNGVRSVFLKSPKNIFNAIRDKNLTLYCSVLEFSCENISYIFKYNTLQVNFRSTRPWLILTNLTNLSFWKNYFMDVKIRLDSNVHLIFTEMENYILFKVFNLGRYLGGWTTILNVGEGNDTYFSYKDSRFYYERKNMTGINLRATSVILVHHPLEKFEDHMFDRRFKEQDTQSKFHYPQFLYLKDIHNFTFNLSITDKWYGNSTAGIDGGAAQLLHEDLADICCTGGAQRYSRVDVLDYVMPSYHFRPCYIFRNPGSYDPMTNEFLTPFATESWFAILFISIFIAMILKMSFGTENTIFKSKTRYAWSTVILITMSTIFQQGSSIIPSRFVGRLIFFILLLFSVLIYNYYTSSILSSLLSSPPSVIDSLEQLGHSSLSIGIENLPYTITWFIITNTSDVQYIYHKKVTLPRGGLNILTPEEGIAKVRRGGFAYYTQLDTGYPLIERSFDQDEICDLAKLPMLPQTLGGLIVQKRSQYLKLFQISLNMVRQSGLIKRLYWIWESKTPICLSTSRVIPVGIEQTFIAFLILIIGSVLSIIILLIELLLYKMNK